MPGRVSYVLNQINYFTMSPLACTELVEVKAYIYAVGKLAKGSLSFRVSANYLGGKVNFIK